jgi:hypothetical protein
LKPFNFNKLIYDIIIRWTLLKVNENKGLLRK